MPESGVNPDREPMAPRWFAPALTSVFFVLELINLLHHAMWEDEMQVWSFATHSHSVRELFHVTRYEGHPHAWQFLVYVVSRWSSNPVAMQILHLAIATITAYVVARYSPFPWFEKVLIVFGYFFFFEYATISRDYALGILCLVSFCAVFRPGPEKRYGLLAILLGLMAESNIYALILALSLALMMVFEAMQSPQPRQYIFSRRGELAGVAVLFLTAVLISLHHIRPPANAEWDTRSQLVVHTRTGFSGTLAMMWRAFVPIPQLSRRFWNSNLLLGDHTRGMAVLSILLFGISVLFFVRKRTVLFLYVSGLAALTLFKQLVYGGGLRHDGHAFILFLACVWLGKSYPEQRFPLPIIETAAERLRPYQDRLFRGLLVGQVIAALVASVIALKVPFSESRAASDFLRSKRMDQMFIIGDSDIAVSPIAGYLNREIYYPQGSRMGSYVIWDQGRTPATEPTLELGRRKAAEQHQDVLVILNFPDQSAHEIASFQGGTVPSENYYMYWIPPEKPKTISSPGR
ncbi:MAG: hypothetical protein ABSA57_16830 [Candidatus Acidiferrales bacterium]|jgi:hypothetical protein